ncbi:hypothetical protein UFOVP623_12 [uncultured Caudovirales phage]|uniref:Portal protein n=1 Tax=uncultured Caudovirales phage TaxID=2100421 RepID=A0A6J5N5Q5_9CAUD|nr:hypothetical protein UFOVP623_12 [uncultured Caudovirales phage]
MKNKDLLHRCPIYTAIYQTMSDYQLAYLGGTAFKRQARKKRPSEDEKIHIDLVTHTVAQPICRYIVDTLNNYVFEPGIKRELRFATPDGTPVDEDFLEWAELFQMDANMSNNSLTGVMEQIGQLSSIFGHCWVFVDMPKASEGDAGRPYVCTVSPMDVWDWKFDYYNGRQILKYVKVKEFEESDCWYFKCYHLGDSENPSYWESYEVDKGDNVEGEATLLDKGTFPPGMAIPGFIAYGRRDPRRTDVGMSDIDNASDAQREHYKLETEAYQSIQFAKTIIRADAGIKVPAHAGAIVRAQQGQIESIKVDTQDVEVIIKKQQDILDQLEKLLGFGGLRKNMATAQSGVSMIEERRNIHKLARAKARLMEICEEQIWTFAARFVDMRWAGEVNYDTDYEASDTDYRLALLNQAKTLAGDNPIIQGLIVKELVTLLCPPEEVNDYVIATLPTLPTEYQSIVAEENDETYTRDLGSQVPDKGEIEPAETDESLATYSGLGTGITYTGQSSYNPIADQLVGQASGR